MVEPHSHPWFPDKAVEACTEEIWEAIAALTDYTPRAIARGLFENLDGLVDALLIEGLCAPEEVRWMAARLSERARATGGAEPPATP